MHRCHLYTLLFTVSLLNGCQSVSFDEAAVTIDTQQQSYQQNIPAPLPPRNITKPTQHVLQKSSKNYFQFKPVVASQQLPQSRIPVLEFEAAMLSDVLIQLLKTVNLKLAIVDEMPDKRLFDLRIAGTFEEAIDKLAMEAGFMYRLEDGVLSIAASQQIKLTLPPLGFLNEPLSQETYRFLISDLESILKTRPSFKHNEKQAWLEFKANAAQLQLVKGYVTAFKNEKQLIAYKGSLLNLEKPLKPFKQLIDSDDVLFKATQHPLLTVNQLKGVAAVKSEQDFLASIISGHPLSVTFNCDNKKKIRLDMQPKWFGNKLKNNIFMRNCNDEKDTITLTSNVNENQLILLSPQQIIVLEPLVLSF